MSEEYTAPSHIKITVHPHSAGGSGVTVEPITITENGVYEAPRGTAYSPVTVNVPQATTIFKVTIHDLIGPTISSGWPTIQPTTGHVSLSSGDVHITENHVVLSYEFSDPYAALGDWSITTYSNRIDYSGYLSGTTDLIIYLGEVGGEASDG